MAIKVGDCIRFKNTMEQPIEGIVVQKYRPEDETFWRYVINSHGYWNNGVEQLYGLELNSRRIKDVEVISNLKFFTLDEMTDIIVNISETEPIIFLGYAYLFITFSMLHKERAYRILDSKIVFIKANNKIFKIITPFLLDSVSNYEGTTNNYVYMEQITEDDLGEYIKEKRFNFVRVNEVVRPYKITPLSFLASIKGPLDMSVDELQNLRGIILGDIAICQLLPPEHGIWEVKNGITIKVLKER